jgi:hypothetical protein
MALQTQKQEVLELNHSEQHMLTALVRLHEKQPERKWNYANISDEVRDYTKHKVVPTLHELHLAKPKLVEHGFVHVADIGFIPTQAGIKFFRENKHKLTLH